MRTILYGLLVLFAGEAYAAPTVTLTAAPTSGISPVDVVLTWSSTGATSCTASGGWTGTKATSGTQTITGVTASATYTLTCSEGSGSADLSWTAPTKNTDGSALTNLAGYKVRAATSAAGLATATAVTVGPAVTAYTWPNLAAGTWFFDVRASNSAGIDSAPTPAVSTAIVLASATANASVTVNTQPNPPSGLTVVQKTAYEIKSSRWDGVILGRNVGTVPLGTACGSEPIVGTSYYEVPRKSVTFTKTPKSDLIVAKCG